MMKRRGTRCFALVFLFCVLSPGGEEFWGKAGFVCIDENDAMRA
jgi:hypothetical protein